MRSQGKYGGGTPSTIATGQDQCTYPYSGPSVELDVATGEWLVAIQGADGLNQDAGAIAIGKQLVGALASK